LLAGPYLGRDDAGRLGGAPPEAMGTTVDEMVARNFSEPPGRVAVAQRFARPGGKVANSICLSLFESLERD